MISKTGVSSTWILDEIASLADSINAFKLEWKESGSWQWKRKENCKSRKNWPAKSQLRMISEWSELIGRLKKRRKIVLLDSQITTCKIAWLTLYQILYLNMQSFNDFDPPILSQLLTKVGQSKVTKDP